MVFLKRREATIQECEQLLTHMNHPDVYPFVREKSANVSHLLFLTKNLIEQEERGECITRTIMNEKGQAVGCISLYDIHEKQGFLATWIGKEFHGNGMNQQAKELFLDHLFFAEEMDGVFLKVRKANGRSRAAIEKLPYACLFSETHLLVDPAIYDLFHLSRLAYTSYKNFISVQGGLMA